MVQFIFKQLKFTGKCNSRIRIFNSYLRVHVHLSHSVNTELNMIGFINCDHIPGLFEFPFFTYKKKPLSKVQRIV